MTPSLRPWLAALGLLACAAPVGAQQFRCSSDTGTYYTDRPCPGEPGARQVPVGPQPSRRLPPAAGPSGTAEHTRYLSPDCADLHDALRTARSRGLSYRTVEGLRNEYARQCTEEELQAREQVEADRRKAWDARAQARKAAEQERQQARQKTEHCLAMKDAIQSRRRRASDLSDEQLAALREVELTYNARCLGG